jgi:hypothetical protein
MRVKGLKRLEVLVPEQHPIMAYPSGARSKIAREWLDMGARLSELEKQLTEIREMLSRGAVKTQPEPLPSQAEKKQKVNMAKLIEDAFS